jgi:hypothetical protein
MLATSTRRGPVARRMVDVADDRLSALLDRYVLHDDLLHAELYYRCSSPILLPQQDKKAGEAAGDDRQPGGEDRRQQLGFAQVFGHLGQHVD